MDHPPRTGARSAPPATVHGGSPPLPHRPPLPLFALFALFTLLAACGAEDDDTAYTPKPIAFHAIGTMRGTDASGDVVAYDFDGQPATVAIAHRRGAPGATSCIDTITIRTSPKQAPSSCTLTLKLAPRPAGQDGYGMIVSALALEGSGACPWGSGDGKWSLVQSEAWAPVGDYVEGDADKVPLDKLLIWPRGTVRVEGPGSGSPIALELGDLSFGGDAISVATDGATCTPCQAPDCQPPFPTWRLRDFEPQSRHFNLAYDFNNFLGKPAVAILTQGW